MKAGKKVAAYFFILIASGIVSWVSIPNKYSLPENSINQSNDNNQQQIVIGYEEEHAAERNHIDVPDTAVPSTRNNIPIDYEHLPRGETVTVLVNARTGGVVQLGAASITIPPNALEEDTEITITRLLVTMDTGTLNNATANGGGYRFLPEGQQFREPATVRLPYEESLEWKPAVLEELTTYYYDEELGTWEALIRLGLDEEAGVLISATTHFTDMINGTLTLPEGPEPLSFNINSIKGLEAADPSAGVLQPEGLEANYMGSAGFRFNLALPAGRAGMTPQVAVSYSSEGGNGILGKGWNLEAGGEVTYDTRRGLPEYGTENGPFLLDGVVLTYKGPENGIHVYTPR